jgi:hypothetical protein
MDEIKIITAGSANITLRNATIGPNIVVDELILDAADLELAPGSDGQELRFSSGETRFRGMFTEASVNKIVASNIQADTPVRNIKVSLYTGRAQVKGQFVKSVMSLPFTLDAKPVLTNGIRLSLDCSATQIGGIGLPGAAVDIIERVLNEKLYIDLTGSTFPVRFDEVKCEPGRLTVIGRARFSWPPVPSLAADQTDDKPNAAIESK